MVRWTGLVSVLVGVLGFIVAAGAAVAVIYFVRKPLSEFLERLLGDKVIAKSGTTFVGILLALRGLSAAFGFIRQPNLNDFFGSILGMLNAMADEVQWVVWIGALLFIGYSILGRSKSDAEE